MPILIFCGILSLYHKIPNAYGGEGGIRTHGSVNATPDFESGTFDHSATSPGVSTNSGAHSTSKLQFRAECSHAEPDSMFANVTCQPVSVAGRLRSTNSAMDLRQAGGVGSGNRTRTGSGIRARVGTIARRTIACHARNCFAAARQGTRRVTQTRGAPCCRPATH